MITSSEFSRFPKDWKVLPFLDVFNDATSKGIKIKKENYDPEGTLPVVDQGKKLFGGFTSINNKADVTLPAIIFGDHTKIFKLIYTEFAVGADGVKLLEPKVEADKKFLFFYLNQLQLEDAGYSRHFKFLKQTYIPLPPLETQKQIAAVLEKADQLRKDCQQMEQELNSLAQSVFIEIFGDPVTNPKGWPMKKLGEICKKITDGEHQNPTFIEDGYPMVMAKNVQEEGVDLINTKKISLDDLIKFRKKCGAEKGDLLLVSRGATIGRCKEVDTTTDFALMGSVILMKPKVGLVSGAYLESIFRHPGIFSKLTKSSSASAQEAIYLKHVKDLVIPIPPKGSFEQLINFNLALDTMLIDLNIQLQEANQYFNALMQKAFNGELNLDNAKTQ